MTQTLSLNTVLSAKDDLLTSNLSQTEMVMMNLDRGEYYGMEQPAKRIWELLAQPCSVAQLCDRLMAEFDVDRAACEEEVLAFLAELLEADLIHVENSEPAA